MREKNRKNAIEKMGKVLYNKIKEERKEANAVTFDTFLPDYGILPSAYFERSAITNPIELFWSDELLALLRLCGQKEEMVGERASDYDRFLSICRSLPLLEGHSTRAWIASILEEYFNLKELPTEETTPTAWKNICAGLMQKPLSPQEFVSGAWLCDALVVPTYLPHNVTPVLNANLLLNTTAQNATVWSEEIAATVEHFAEHGCPKIVLQLPNDFAFIAPSVYHIDKCLQSAKHSRDADNLLLCQLMRELSSVAQQNKLLLLLVCKANAGEVSNLLEYCENSVGLPRVCWSLREVREAHALLTFTAKPRKNEIFAALPYETIMTEHELFDALESWKARYPVGRLCFLTARDLRQMPYAQAHIADMLEKVKTKI